MAILSLSCGHLQNNNSLNSILLKAPNTYEQVRFVEGFILRDQMGKSHELYNYSDKKAVVLISQGNGCPISRRSMPYIQRMQDEYAQKEVKFFMINANVQDDRDAIQQELESFPVNIPVLKDDSQATTQSLGIRRTAEAIVIDPEDWRIVYQGAVDDRFGYESQKTRPTQQYLKDVIDALLEGREVNIKRRAGKGCLINFEI